MKSDKDLQPLEFPLRESISIAITCDATVSAQFLQIGQSWRLFCFNLNGRSRPCDIFGRCKGSRRGIAAFLPNFFVTSFGSTIASANQT